MLAECIQNRMNGIALVTPADLNKQNGIECFNNVGALKFEFKFTMTAALIEFKWTMHISVPSLNHHDC